jgi:hypothetical protein
MKSAAGVKVANHPFEPELAQPPPRRICGRGGRGDGCLRVFILPHTIVGMGLLVGAVTRTLIWLAVLLFGTEIQGQVVRKTESRGSKGHWFYSVEYTFRLDGVDYTDRVSLGEADYAAVKEGQVVDVRAVKWMPERGHWPQLRGYWPLWEVGILWFAALFWNGILSVFLWQAYGRPWFQRRLVCHGLVTTGVVRDVRFGRNRGTPCWKIRYEYACAPDDEESGRLYTGSVKATGPEAAAVRAGDILTVLYDPQRPSWSVPYWLAAYRIKP